MSSISEAGTPVRTSRAFIRSADRSSARTSRKMPLSLWARPIGVRTASMMTAWRMMQLLPRLRAAAVERPPRLVVEYQNELAVAIDFATAGLGAQLLQALLAVLGLALLLHLPQQAVQPIPGLLIDMIELGLRRLRAAEESGDVIGLLRLVAYHHRVAR